MLYVSFYLLVNFSSKLLIKLENSKENPRQMHFIVICHFIDLKFSFKCPPHDHGATPQSSWTEQTGKKLNVWGKTVVHKIAWNKSLVRGFYYLKDKIS